MPSTSQKQHNLMEMIAHGGKPDKVKAPPVSVAKDFSKADQLAKAKVLRKRKPAGSGGIGGAGSSAVGM